MTATSCLIQSQSEMLMATHRRKLMPMTTVKAVQRHSRCWMMTCYQKMLQMAKGKPNKTRWVLAMLLLFAFVSPRLSHYSKGERLRSLSNYLTVTQMTRAVQSLMQWVWDAEMLNWNQLVRACLRLLRLPMQTGSMLRSQKLREY
jgi:hypothetical protein